MAEGPTSAESRALGSENQAEASTHREDESIAPKDAPVHGNLPAIGSEEFQQVFGTSNPNRPRWVLKNEDRVPIPDEARRSEFDALEYTSYGNEGTTASATKSGGLIQISRFLGVGRSGFFSVDVEEVSQPWYVQKRAKELVDPNKTANGPAFYSLRSHHLDRKAFFNPWEFEFVHDRWPRFSTTPEKGFTVTAQHFASKDTIFLRRRYEVESIEPIEIMSTSDLFVPLDWYRIRELEFTDSGYDFNSKLRLDYKYILGPHGRSVIMTNSGFVEDERTMSDHECSNTVGLVMAISVNGQIQELEKYEDSEFNTYGVKSAMDVFTVSQAQPLEITVAYRLQLMPVEADWKDSLITNPDFQSMDDGLNMETTHSFTLIPFSTKTHMDFIIRRNLEHILSVCSIPLEPPPAELTGFAADLKVIADSTEEGGSEKKDKKTRRIALTCGDMSGHRVVTSASFFSFHFLLAIFEYLGGMMNLPEGDDGFAQCKIASGRSPVNSTSPCKCETVGKVCQWEFSRVLRNRIRTTCEGHLKWVINAELDEKGCFGANYWATGQKIENESRMEVLSKCSLTDTPFQILKLADFAIKFGGADGVDCSDYVGEVEKRVARWLKKLDEANKRNFAFARPTDISQSQTREYRLEDHVCMWRVLQATEKLSLGKILAKNKKPRGLPGGEEKQEPKLSKNYSSREFQQQVLSRFTVENEISGRMLAVTRTPSENRFQFRSRHTALFYEATSHFFTKSRALWKATIEAQKLHTKNQDARWNNPLRYALALVMSKRNLQINSTSPDEMAKVSEKVLLDSCSGSGIFPGHLNVETKEPEIHPPGWRDFFWHTSFEIPYLFLENSVRTKAPDNAPVTSKSESHSRDSGEEKLREMKNSVPFNNLIDAKCIVELSDEWLYDLPDFLGFPPLEGDVKGDSQSSVGGETNDESFVDLIASASHVGRIKFPRDFDPEDLDKDKLRGVILDIPKKSYVLTRSEATLFDSLDWLSNSSLYKQLKIPRTKDNAKKTILWFPNADTATRGLCCLKSTGAEKVYLSAFFDRHERKDKYFFDEAMAIANTWKTEFHLSSYQLLDEGKGNPEVDTLFLGGGNTIRRAGVGFRFIGDFWDRFWTCHILECEPKEDSERPHLFQSSDPTKEVNKRLEKFKDLLHPKSQHGKDAEKSGQILARQRKVLELLLFDLMLHKINGRYKQMLSNIEIELRQQAQNVRQAKSELPLEPVDPNRPDILSASNILFSSPMNNDSYSSFNDKWPPFQYTLQVMEEDLRETLDKIELWRNREKDRQLERPRWTRDDERQFRPAINKAITSNNRKIRELERYLTSIRSLRTSLASRLESTRNELSFQSAENVRFFTYVTVIFLPLGFATAMFSTSGVPSAKPVGYIVVTAFVTLLLTAVALANAQFLDEKVFSPVANVVHFNKQNHVNHKAESQAAVVLQEESVAGTDSVGGGSTTSSRSTSRKWRHYRWIEYRGQSGKTDGHRAEEGRVRRPK